MNTYQVGDSVKLSYSLSDVGGAADPVYGVRFKMKEPNGTVTTRDYLMPSNVGGSSLMYRTGTGAFYTTWIITSSGVHFYDFQALNSAVAGDTVESEEGFFDVAYRRTTGT